jgi:polysaccharide biosynthesis protein PslG
MAIVRPSAPVVGIVVALACALLACLSLAGTVRAAEPGVVPDLTWWAVTEEQMNRTADLLRDSRPKWVRLDIRWHGIEPHGPGRYSASELAQVDRAVDLALAAGARIDMMVYGAPSWASGLTSGSYYKNAPPRDPADYARVMRFLADRYRGRVSAYEIWNEQNTPRFWPVAGGPNPADYVRLLRAAYPAIKEADPASTVVFGGLSSYHYDFVARSYDAGAKGYFDVMGLHPYADCGVSPDVVYRYPDGRIKGWSFTGYREIRKDMLARGDDKPIWLTEFGWSTSVAENCSNGGWSTGVSHELQAKYLTRAFQIVEQDPYVPVAIWYSFRNYEVAGDPDTIETRFGLLETDFSPKPAYAAFKAYASAGATPLPPPQPGPRPKKPRARTRTTLFVSSAVARTSVLRRRVARRVVLHGRVRGSERGRVRIHVRRGQAGHRGRRVRRITHLGRHGTYRLTVHPRGPGRFRARARFLGRAGAPPSSSRILRFRLR